MKRHFPTAFSFWAKNSHILPYYIPFRARPYFKLTYNALEDHVLNVFKGQNVSASDKDTVISSLAELKVELKGDCYLNKKGGVIAGKYFGSPNADKHYIGGLIIRTLFIVPFVGSIFSQFGFNLLDAYFVSVILVPTSLVVYSDFKPGRSYDHIFDNSPDCAIKPVKRINIVYDEIEREKNMKEIDGKLKTNTKHYP